MSVLILAITPNKRLKSLLEVSERILTQIIFQLRAGLKTACTFEL
ncbi:hypothetical protein LEP1GSC163_2826 [Leptospira santarosai str. CBC379]|nr:hypothetical protein LEP1GSC163_2826 [Leptospira santarosai str. CBC379]